VQVDLEWSKANLWRLRHASTPGEQHNTALPRRSNTPVLHIAPREFSVLAGEA
jgi:hypothetical protein